MATSRARLGAQGEATAAAHLEAKGLRITGRNYRSRYGEIDLIAQDGEAVVFVEVKTQRARGYGTPEESITPRKRERLIKTAERYLAEHGLEQRDWRIDVVGIALRANGPADINHVREI